jgi:N-formylglutamate amidohydrolase
MVSGRASCGRRVIRSMMDSQVGAAQATGATGTTDATGAPFEILAPAVQTIPFVYCSPHSGTDYAPEFLAASPLDLHALRQSEDAFVDKLFAAAPSLGAPLLRALFPRAYLDPNREAYELDPVMFDGALPDYANTRSARVSGGLGTIARVVSNGAEIYRQKLPVAEAKQRIRLFYDPFHAALAGLIAETRARFGYAVLIDCHSMPSVGGPMEPDSGRARTEIVLGDRFATSAAPALTDICDAALKGMGYRVFRNNPYAGGFITQHYGRTAEGVHALQIEINRALYMDEARIEPVPAMARVADNMTALIGALAALGPAHLALKP